MKVRLDCAQHALGVAGWDGMCLWYIAGQTGESGLHDADKERERECVCIVEGLGEGSVYVLMAQETDRKIKL